MNDTFRAAEKYFPDAKKVKITDGWLAIKELEGDALLVSFFPFDEKYLQRVGNDRVYNFWRPLALVDGVIREIDSVQSNAESVADLEFDPYTNLQKLTPLIISEIYRETSSVE